MGVCATSRCGAAGGGGGRAARRPRRPLRGGEEVAHASGSDGEADVATTAELAAPASEAGCLQGFLFSTELFRSFMDN